MEVHIKIRKIRELKGIKQQNIADALDMSQQNYARLEMGINKFTIDRLEQIVQLLGMSFLEFWAYGESNIEVQASNQLLPSEGQSTVAIVLLQDNYNHLQKKVSELQDVTTRLLTLLEKSEKELQDKEQKIEHLQDTMHRAFRYIESLEERTQHQQDTLTEQLEGKMLVVLKKLSKTEKLEIKKELAYEKMMEKLNEKLYNFQQIQTIPQHLE